MDRPLPEQPLEGGGTWTPDLRITIPEGHRYGTDGEIVLMPKGAAVDAAKAVAYDRMREMHAELGYCLGTLHEVLLKKGVDQALAQQIVAGATPATYNRLAQIVETSLRGAP